MVPGGGGGGAGGRGPGFKFNARSSKATACQWPSTGPHDWHRPLALLGCSELSARDSRVAGLSPPHWHREHRGLPRRRVAVRVGVSSTCSGTGTYTERLPLLVVQGIRRLEDYVWVSLQVGNAMKAKQSKAKASEDPTSKLSRPHWHWQCSRAQSPLGHGQQSYDAAARLGPKPTQLRLDATGSRGTG